MEYSNNTPICRRNKHLNEFERSKIEVLSSLGYSPYSIAKVINRSANTVRNEIKRGTVTQIKAGKSTSSYFAETGHIIYTRNRKNCGSKYKLFKCQNFIEHVYKLFYENKHSFDSIVGSHARQMKALLLLIWYVLKHYTTTLIKVFFKSQM